MKLALIASLSLCAASNASADCAYFGLTAKPVTAANTALPPDGGIVIAALPDPAGKLDPGDAALDHPFRVREKPVSRSVAPGLVVMPLPTPFPTQPGVLLDGKGRTVLAFAVTTDKLAPLVAPKVKAIEYRARLGRHSSESVSATIDNLPAGALAIVLSDAKGKPRSFGMIGTQAQTIVYGTSDCQALPNGTVKSKPGDKVTVRIVDALGRVSPPSAPVTVVEAKP